MKHEKFMEMMNGLQQRIEPPDEADVSLNGSFFESLTPKRRLLKSIPKPNSLFSSHPKLQKLEDIVVNHFEKSKEKEPMQSSQTPLNTRIMIFSQYRDSVQEITAVLSKHQPLVNVMSFVGQNGAGKGKKGLSQKEQLEVTISIVNFLIARSWHICWLVKLQDKGFADQQKRRFSVSSFKRLKNTPLFFGYGYGVISLPFALQLPLSF